MKSRSHRFPPSDPPDDWIDGSWTVDCSCGVTFDDGEEMVSCDECGVWVHTRCSRFAKGEASFACHNCKKNNHNSNHSSNSSKKPSPAAADTEETEVAQLLIELPTKADPCPPPPPFPAPAYRAPFRLWAEVPMEDRVHVQGVPGGDPSLFQGISSSVFTSELWRCAGYVPKKFNFKYREFPCCGENGTENPASRGADGTENPASRGADVLFSLSKEIVPSCVPVRAFERKQEGEKVLFGSRLQSWGKKERNKLRVFGSQHSSKRRKEEVGEGKDRSGKKKARSDADRVAAEFKKRGSVHVGEVKKAGLAEDVAFHVAESDATAVKSEERKEDARPEHNLGDKVGVDSVKEEEARSEADRVAAEFKRRVSLPVAETKKFELSEDEGVQVAESDVSSQKLEGSSVRSEERKEDVSSQKSEGLSVKSEERKENVLPQNNASDKVERVDNEIKTENGLVVRTSKEGIADEAASLNIASSSELPLKVETLDGTTGLSSKIASSSELPVKVETADGTSGLSSKATTRVSPKADVSTSSQEKQDDNVKESANGEDLSNVVHALKQSKDESHFQGDPNSSTQAKLVSSGACQKNEKMNQPVPQPPSKLLNHAISMHPPAFAATTLSDEELALLLHQELNSSPRVPRVPRIRQASSMQLTSQIAPSMLSKRSSHSGGKDQVFRRKNKEETSRDGSRNSQDSVDETKRAGRALSSPDWKYQESSCMTDSSSKKDSRNRSPDTIVSMKKNMSGPSTQGENSCLPSFETSGQNTLLIKSSTRDVPDDDTTSRTLPGLIDEILSKCKCSTYEELCDAVRPHWHNVRKPNGDCYAYSSHSHAVLDCLRNRSEWSHLIDRGPKTNSTKRRRKLDSDLPTMEESENEETKNRASARVVEDKIRDSHREDVPKGKRKARKRRRLELQGRIVDEGKKRKRASSSGSAIVSDDDDNDDDESAAAFSHSSNEEADGIFSDYESQVAVGHTVGAEASASTSSDG